MATATPKGGSRELGPELVPPINEQVIATSAERGMSGCLAGVPRLMASNGQWAVLGPRIRAASEDQSNCGAREAGKRSQEGVGSAQGR